MDSRVVKGVLGFLVLVLVVAGLTWKLTERLERGKLHHIGIARWVSNDEFDRNIAGFKEELTAAGYVEGRNVRYLTLNPEADRSRHLQGIKNWVEMGIDLIYSLTTPGTLIVKEQASEIPVVFSIVTFPVEAGVIRSLSSSENNLVGTRNFIPMLRQFNVFRSVVPNATKVAFVHRLGEPNSEIQLREFERVAKSKNFQVIGIAAKDTEDLKSQLELHRSKIDSVFSACDTLVQSGGEEVVIAFVKKYRLPDFTCNKSGVQKGGLVGNVADFAAIGSLSGKMAVEILKGEAPRTLSSESPLEDYIVLNLNRAKELRLKVKSQFINRVSELIR